MLFLFEREGDREFARMMGIIPCRLFCICVNARALLLFVAEAGEHACENVHLDTCELKF
jgi:hypothetical protein